MIVSQDWLTSNKAAMQSEKSIRYMHNFLEIREVNHGCGRYARVEGFIALEKKTLILENCYY